MPYSADSHWEYEYPAHVVSVVDGGSFYADIDLGFHVTIRMLVIVEGIEVTDGVSAKKEAQRLLNDAELILRTKRLMAGGAVLAEVMYSPFFTARSEQGSFSAAMAAAGFARSL